MGESIIVAIITGGLALIGTIVTVMSQNSKTRSAVAEQQAETRAAMIKEQTETRKDIQYLSDEVKKHNNFAQRMPVVEEQIKVINHRIDDLERKVEQ